MCAQRVGAAQELVEGLTSLADGAYYGVPVDTPQLCPSVVPASECPRLRVATKEERWRVEEGHTAA
jgi:hypothetical protein